MDDNISLISDHFVVSEVLSVIQNLKEGKGITFWVLSGNTKIAFSVSILLHSTLVMYIFFRHVWRKEFPEKSSFLSGFQATGSCLLPRASPKSPAERLSHWSPPACPPLEECQPCPATWSRSPLQEPESWRQENKTQLHTVHSVIYESQKDTP